MKKRIFSLFLAIFLLVSFFSWSSLSAASLHVRKVVSVVYDDSGSMSLNNSMNWSYANYAVQTLCGLLNAEDELTITYMSNPGTAVIPTDFSSNRQNAVDNIRSSLNSGNTPQSAITTAQNKLVESYGNNRSSGIKTEYWLVVLSDGEFNEQGVFGKAGLDTALQDFSKVQIADGMDPHTIYLAIGSNAIEAASVPALSIITRKCDDGKAIVSVLSELSNDISGRYRISKDFITLVDDKTVELTTEIPLVNIAILMQNSSAMLDSIVSDQGTALSIVQQVSLKYPEKTGWTSDTSLNGKAFLVENAGQSISAGKYTLKFSDTVDINALDIMVEPAFELRLSILKNGSEVTDLSSLQEKDTIDLQMKLYESGTNNAVDTALLKGDIKSSLGYKENDVDIASTDTMVLKGITLKNLKTGVYGTLTFGNFLPLTVLIEFTPPVRESNLELRLSVMKNGQEVTDLSSLRAADIISVTAHIFDITSGSEVDISTLGNNITDSIGYSENDTEVLSAAGMSLSDISVKAAKTDLFASLQIGESAPLTVLATFNPTSQDTPVTTAVPENPINPADKTVYKIIIVPEGLTVDRDDLSNGTAVIRFVFAGDGLLLTKEESKGLSFQISLDRNIPYSLQQEDDGSYTFRPKAQWPPLFYPTGKFTVTGTLNNTVTNSTVFEVTSVHLFKDIITLIWPLFILAYLVFYLTRKRFIRSYITRKIYFVADGAIREGSKSQVFVKPSTGWRQFFNHASILKYAYLIFVASHDGEVAVRYLLQKPIDYQVAPLTDNLEEIEKIFSGELWKIAVKFDKNIRISESTALYIRTKNNISVYYIRKWKKRANKRAKSDAASSNNDDDVMYMYEHGESSQGYDSVADLKRDAVGIVTGTVISAKPIFRSNILHTLTEVSVETVYIGPFSKGDVIYIEEQGGQVTMQDYIRGTDLENEDVEEITTATEKKSVVVGIDGYYPMPVGRHVLLFVQDSGLKTEEMDQKIYSCLGGYNGIFYQQSDKYTYVNPKPDASGIHASLDVLCTNGGRLSVTAGELYKKKHE